MVGAVLVLLLITVIAVIVFWMSMGATVAESRDREHRLNEPETPTLLYAVPAGVDPAMIRVSLEVAGFESVVEEVVEDQERVELIRVACLPDQREAVREAVAHAPVDNDNSADLEDVYGEVHFLDEAA